MKRDPRRRAAARRNENKKAPVARGFLLGRIMKVDDPYTVDGEPAKHIGISSDVGDVGSFDTFEEAWKGYQDHREKIMPILKKRTKKAEGRYWFRVNNKQVTLEEFRWAMDQERRDKKDM